MVKDEERSLRSVPRVPPMARDEKQNRAGLRSGLQMLTKTHRLMDDEGRPAGSVRMKTYCVYILREPVGSSLHRVATDLEDRVRQHREKFLAGFTSR